MTIDSAFILELIKLNNAVLTALTAIRDGIEDGEGVQRKTLESLEGVNRALSSLQIHSEIEVKDLDALKARIEKMEREFERLSGSLTVHHGGQREWMARIEAVVSGQKRGEKWVESVGGWIGARLAEGWGALIAFSSTRFGQLIFLLFGVGFVLDLFGVETISATRSLIASLIGADSPPPDLPGTPPPTPSPESP